MHVCKEVCLIVEILFISILKLCFFCLLPQGNIVQLDLLCSGNNLLSCGDDSYDHI